MKNYVKGIFDTKTEKLHILVTGSARLDVFRYSGDSLAGRFYSHRLMPFSLKEIPINNELRTIDRLIERGGFPEPFLLEDETDARRWRNQYLDGMIRNDILDFENVHDLKSLNTLIELLRQRVGSPISYSGLAEDLQISPNTVKRYIGIFEALYIVFRVTPYSKNIARSLLKEPKIFFFDTGLVEGNEGLKFENFAAVSLLKHCYHSEDVLGFPLTLNYLRTKDGRETDFCISSKSRVESIIEVKLSDNELANGIKYFHNKYKYPAVQVVKHLRNEYQVDGIEVRNAFKYFSGLLA